MEGNESNAWIWIEEGEEEMVKKKRKKNEKGIYKGNICCDTEQ